LGKVLFSKLSKTAKDESKRPHETNAFISRMVGNERETVGLRWFPFGTARLARGFSIDNSSDCQNNISNGHTLKVKVS
jgi:hypothetical protein